MGKRILLFPLPLQGHQTPMLQLAYILHSKGFDISVIHTQFNAPNSAIHPHFTFHPIPGSLLEDEAEAYKEDVIALLIMLNAHLVTPFRNLVVQISSEESVACIITDAMWHFTQQVADSLGLPRIVLRTSNAACFNAFMYCRVFEEKGYLSAKGSELEEEVPELRPLKVKDILLIHGKYDRDVTFELVCAMVEQTKASRGLILNTFQELESPSLSMIREKIPIPLFAVGPFHKQVTASSSSLLTPDRNCISWLDVQKPKSVLYVSFGSIASIDKQDLLEIAWGLANSKQSFLWVVRPGLVHGSDGDGLLPNGLMDIVAQQGRIVKWAPQDEVLAHPAIGGFWTHCGWNSTLESICEGVPMLCSPCFGDQTINARYVTDVWRVGFRFENKLNREDVENAIRKLMLEKEGEEMRQNITYLKDEACLSTATGGSFHRSLESLVTYILSF